MKRYVAAALVLLLAVPVAGQTGELEVEVTVTAQKSLDMDMAQAAAFDNCDGYRDGLVRLESIRGFKFTDGLDERGCAEVTLAFVPYPDAQNVIIDFDALLHVGETVGTITDQDPNPPVFEASLRATAGTVETNQEIFESVHGGKANSFPQPTAIKTEDRVEQITAAWRFQDLGKLVAADAGALGHRYHIDIIDPVARFEDVILKERIDREDVGSNRVETIKHAKVSVTVRDDFDLLDLSFVLSSKWDWVGLELDGGARLDDRFVLEERVNNGEDLRVYFQPEVLSYFGGGNYTAIFELRTPVVATPLMVPFLIGVAAAPLMLGAYATGAALRFSAQAVGRYKVTARNLRLTLYLIWALYVILVGALLFGQLWTLAASWPVSTEAALIHGSFVALAAGFVLLGFYWRRQLDVMMRGELAEKERHNRDLQRSNQELEQFAYVASHDLQEPLRTVARFTQLLERRYGAQLDDDAREFMAYSVDGAKRMQALIDDLLTFSRVDSRGKPMAPVVMDEVLERVRLGMTAAIEESGAKVTWDALPVVMGDASQLAQLMQNVLSNALKFRNTKQKPKVHIGAKRLEGYWEISVQDNGIGIEPEYLERIFVVFQRLHARDEYEGTGIGLAVCKKIVERHGGQLWVESKVGKGSVFRFTLKDASSSGV